MQATKPLRLNYEFRRVYQKGSCARGRYLLLYLRRRQAPGRLLGVTVSRKLKGACRRNRIKRRLRALYQADELRLRAPYELIVQGRESVLDAPFADLQKEFRRLISQLDLWEV